MKYFTAKAYDDDDEFIIQRDAYWQYIEEKTRGVSSWPLSIAILASKFSLHDARLSKVTWSKNSAELVLEGVGTGGYTQHDYLFAFRFMGVSGLNAAHMQRVLSEHNPDIMSSEVEEIESTVFEFRLLFYKDRSHQEIHFKFDMVAVWVSGISQEDLLVNDVVDCIFISD